MKKIVLILSFLPAVIWMVLIFSFSAAPAVESSETSDGISYKIVKVMAALPFWTGKKRNWKKKRKLSMFRSARRHISANMYCWPYCGQRLLAILQNPLRREWRRHSCCASFMLSVMRSINYLFLAGMEM